MNIKNLQIIRRNKKRAWALCPFHLDRHKPNLAITLEGECYGMYHCFTCGASGRLSSKKMKKLNLMKSKRIKPADIDWRTLTTDYQFNLYDNYPEKLIELQTKWNVSKHSLIKFEVGWDEEAWTFPMSTIYPVKKQFIDEDYKEEYDEYICGISRRFPDGSKGSVEGSKLGLFIPKAFYSRDKILYITEGLSDAISVYDLGLSVIGKPCATYGNDLIVQWLDCLYGKLLRVVIIPDNDTVGQNSAEDLAVYLVEKCKVPVFALLFEYDVRAKDIREYIAKVGKSRVTKELQSCIK